MKVLLCIRSDYCRNFAGDSMQVLKTAQYLRKMGVEVDINDGSIVNYSKYNIVHLFNLTRIGETYSYYKRAKTYKKTIVLSSVYWDLKKYYNYVNDLENIKLWDKCKAYRLEILKGCKMIYPNSKMEGDTIKKEFGDWISYNVIYNGVEVESEDVPLYNFKERFELNNYVLCVGRICHRKNQLILAKVCNDLGLQLVLIGNVNDKEYFNKCINYSNVKYLGFMDSYNIYNAYRFCKIHVLPSFVETPGLSSLEAAAAGCNIVSTSEGSSKEYFKNMAEYCNPYNQESITEAIVRSIKKPKTEILKKYTLDNFNWERCIKELYNSYNQIIK
ncbi:glycosyltransferase [Clostridium sp. OS1-26]|uniref:glycosyltransferase family 4 protein n=1 Tax=Clostridium sp. OS1-26 TaxID=3070681 RepID=UPI0027E074A7|nr:glycosyltransferase [Clostridium sp. OS1-26]WML35820.1 glycosyltransferase [Clostridium sp. OS1-26]